MQRENDELVSLPPRPMRTEPAAASPFQDRFLGKAPNCRMLPRAECPHPF